ncbi:predicted protein [Naegleria gruberi]|uniref:Predicted protein n=1 Tax=Naegleria gruberi TaxID=5762 RepID=D2V604_NAEGR|nr:uncharacterized protein NAEGRDRAFT_64265 [Naegleria gruberi]EFC47738.1 predicted protein [Naegleria gruberi]|eukprot:XP_002680482.1 predicted protein [Naegleria gruberi strain NEG-M]
MTENLHNTPSLDQEQGDGENQINPLKRKAISRDDDASEHEQQQQLERIPKRLKNYFQTRKEEIEYDDRIEEVDFSSSLSKGTEIIKTWHVRKARNLLLELVQIEVGGVVPNSIKDVLDDVLKRREEIESLSLYLAERMVIKIQVHSTDFINDLLESNRIICPANEISQAKIMFGDESEETLRENLHNWKKYTLPNLVEIQKQLNLADDNEQEGLQNLDENEKQVMKNLMEYEEITHDDDFAYHLDRNHNPLGYNYNEDERLERLNSLDETEIKEVHEKSQWNNASNTEPVFVHFDKESKEYVYTTQELEEYDGFVNDEAFYFKYLFDEMLPDESQTKYTESPFADMKFSLEPKYHNPFLFILETTMTMFEKNQTPQEHHSLEVSYLRLATSLFILNCINTELVYLLNRVSKKSYELMARATVRGVIDSFIDNRNFSCFRMDHDIYTYSVVTAKENEMVKEIEEDLNYVLNGDDSTLRDDESDNETNETIGTIINSEEKDKENVEPTFNEGENDANEEPMLNEDDDHEDNEDDEDDNEGDEEEKEEKENQDEEDEGYLSMDTDTDTDSDIENDNYMVGHPLWDNPMEISQFDIEEMNHYKRKMIDPVAKSLSSTFEFLKSDHTETEEELTLNEDGEEDLYEERNVREPIVNQELVTQYYSDDGHFVNDDNAENDVWGSMTIAIPCAEHILDFEISMESQLPTSNSIYRDLTRLMRRGSVMHADSGAYFESFLQLKEYIQGVVEWISLKNTEKTVTEEDMLNALKFVHRPHFTGGHGSYDFETPCEYVKCEFKFDTKPQFPPESLTDVQVERQFFYNAQPIEKREILVDERFENNDPLTDNNHLADCICHFLGDMSEIPGSNIVCDTFIEFEDGRKLGLYSPLIKIRCPIFFNDFMSDSKQGISVQTIKEKLPRVNFDNLYEFFEYVYRGVTDLEDLEGSLLDSYVHAIEAMFRIEDGEMSKDTTILYNDSFNSCSTLYKLWKDDSTKDFTLFFRNDGDEKVEIKVHKFILASRIEFFRKIIIENPDLTCYDLSEVVKKELVLERFGFYLYYNDLKLQTDRYVESKMEEDLEGVEENSENEDKEMSESENSSSLQSKQNEEKEPSENDENNEMIKSPENSENTAEENEEVDEIEDEEELTFDEFVELFKLAHKFKENNLSKIASRSITHEINYTNIVDFLTLSIDCESYDLFKACEFILLSSDKELVEQVTELEDEREYFNTLRGPIDESNVIEKLSYVMRILNAPSCDLDFLFIYSLDEFHKRNLIWYIVRNISYLNTKVIQSLQFIRVDDKTNCAQLVQSLARRYHSSLDSFTNIPTTGESFQQDE